MSFCFVKIGARLIAIAALMTSNLCSNAQATMQDELPPVSNYQMPEYRVLEYPERQTLINQADSGDEKAQDQLTVYIAFNGFDAVTPSPSEEISPYLSFLFQYYTSTESIDTNCWPLIRDKAIISDDYGYLLGQMVNRKIVSEVNPLIFSNLKRRAELGNVNAQYVLGFYYECGVGVEKDPGLAVQWYLKASDNGKGAAKLRLGHCYAQGLGVGKDFVAASIMINKAAQQGLIDARQNLRFFLSIKPYVQEKSESLCIKASQIYEKLSGIISHCELKSKLNDGTPGFYEASYAIDPLKEPYDTAFRALNNKLCPLIWKLGKAKCGFMLTCLGMDGSYFQAENVYVYKKPSSFLIDNCDNTITIGKENVDVAKEWIECRNKLNDDINQALRTFRSIQDSLRPSVAALHAYQQAVLMARKKVIAYPEDKEASRQLEEARCRFNTKKAKYEEIAALNQIEIDALSGFIVHLSSIQSDLRTLISSTQSARNDEFLKFWELSPIKEDEK